MRTKATMKQTSPGMILALRHKKHPNRIFLCHNPAISSRIETMIGARNSFRFKARRRRCAGSFPSLLRFETRCGLKSALRSGCGFAALCLLRVFVAMPSTIPRHCQ